MSVQVPASYLLAGCELDVCKSNVTVCKHTSLSKYCMHCVCMCVCVVLFPHLVCSPHTGWRTSAVFSGLQSLCWRLLGYATFLLLCAAAPLAAPQHYSARHRGIRIQSQQVLSQENIFVHFNNDYLQLHICIKRSFAALSGKPSTALCQITNYHSSVLKMHNTEISRNV